MTLGPDHGQLASHALGEPVKMQGQTLPRTRPTSSSDKPGFTSCHSSSTAALNDPGPPEETGEGPHQRPSPHRGLEVLESRLSPAPSWPLPWNNQPVV